MDVAVDGEQGSTGTLNPYDLFILDIMLPQIGWTDALPSFA